MLIIFWKISGFQFTVVFGLGLILSEIHLTNKDAHED